jgi:uncharacterized oxidoreductase
MELKNNTILITGGSSGIGGGLADAFHKLGNRVIIAGRRQSALDAFVSTHPGTSAQMLDVTDSEAISTFADKIVSDFPDLNVLINNAGIAGIERLKTANNHGELVEAIISTNILAPIRLTSALLPHLLSRPRATIVNVGSGLAHVPLAAFPTYSASKAAIHSYTQSLRYQLEGSSVEVIELIPPAVHTSLGGNDPTQSPPPGIMLLADFIRETIRRFALQRPTAPMPTCFACSVQRSSSQVIAP